MTDATCTMSVTANLPSGLFLNKVPCFQFEALSLTFEHADVNADGEGGLLPL